MTLANSDPWDDAFNELYMKENGSKVQETAQGIMSDDPWDQAIAESNTKSTPAEDEGFWRNLTRTLYQFPAGLAKRFTYPLDLLNMMSYGSAVDPEAIEDIRRASERYGIPFDEEEYLHQAAELSRYFPTQSNIERGIESTTGLPLEAKTKTQKLARLSGEAYGFTPGTAAQKGTAAIAAPVIKETAEELGVPEELAEMIGLGV